MTPFIKWKKSIIFVKILFFLISWCVFESEKAKKMKEKKEKFESKSFFTIVFSKISKNVKIWVSKKHHYWYFLLFWNSEKAIFSAPLCSEKKSVHPLTHRGKLFLFFIFFFAQGNRVFSAFVHGTLVTLTNFFQQKKNKISGVHFEKKCSKNYIYT